MTIYFVTASSGVWGAETSMITLAAALHADGTRVGLICQSDAVEEAWRSNVNDAVANVGGPRFRTEGGDQRLASNLRIWKAVRTREDAEAVVVFSYYLALGAIAGRFPVRGRHRPRLILDLHDNLEGPRGRAILRVCSVAFDQIICVSRHTASQLRSKQSAVLYRPIKSPPDSDQALFSGRVTVGVVGRLTPQKNIDLAFDAFRQLAEKPCHLLVRGGPGDGGQENFSDDLIRRGRAILGPAVTFEGAVPWDQALRGINLLVVCNANEPMGRTVAEAQLAGIPVLVPDQGGSQELVQDLRTGLIYRANDASSMANKITWAVEHQEELSSIASRALNVATVRHDPSHYASSYLAYVRARR